MADIQVQRRQNPRTGCREDYLSLRWVDPVTGKRRSSALGFVDRSAAQAARKLKEADMLLLSQAASSSQGAGERLPSSGVSDFGGGRLHDAPSEW